MFRKILSYFFVGLIFFILGLYTPRSINKPTVSLRTIQETIKEVKQEPVESKIPDTETAKWQGKTTDWLGRTFDVNNSGKEYDGKSLKQVFSSGWMKPNDPYTIDKGDLEKVEMSENNSWKTFPEQKISLDKADISIAQRQYFYDNNYVPRSVEHFDVTGDGVAETVVTSLSLGCGRCVDFYITIFTNESKYIAIQREGSIIKTENGNGFYLVDIDYSSDNTTINFSKYKWNNSKFTEIARKETIYMTGFGSLVTYYGVVSRISTSGEARFNWYDTNTKRVIDPDNQYAWFWAMPIKVPDDTTLTDKWVKFIQDNKDSVFKITGTKGEDDCDYWGDWTQNKCMQNIDIKTIEVEDGNYKMEF
ncbi:MAG: hypothetical protein UW64_C0016G0009 [Microgenomates group bacterium GW2011_GWC1_44_37]|uniref:Uncharacterized protein n=1 Tax=Candidatus Collierbacteria bacterium GW2011_GWB2_44_22 TaxID=1618387 RepID=A0A0G1HXK2_9BACT|nr:MAG: hypothetical protein UW31_C0006G0067 [Candidatus Collierbacteria bacterium GW2011_GWA2_44_13]KKT50045.1 MAG: hypothetical protein UW42_C0025G0007 [Candidatus Collierbacteria bacterium GW2011_GWB1_44_197]KKT51348.1 MAG: hypothetical protein UW44_C0013G0068 [Candidatus Collierbacteria bacterium GW2011_GWB2_44_22]KKT61474.1 MAG: hypothetical protein UW56_C0025G0011 [Candidatus Collierbacteria bacterium GW2011_GWD1_44_27]KKT65631.1 MAG: hypothetical protein UW58_C0024G0010 [Candidatus Colli